MRMKRIIKFIVSLLISAVTLSTAQNLHPVFGMYHPRISDNIDPRIDGELTIRPDVRNVRKAWIENVVPEGPVLAMMSTNDDEGNRIYYIPAQVVGGYTYPTGSLVYTHSSRSIVLSVGEDESEISFMGYRLNGHVVALERPPVQPLPPLDRTNKPRTDSPTPLPPPDEMEPVKNAEKPDSSDALANWESDKVAVNESIILKNVHFVLSQAILLPESYPELDKLFQFMRSHPTLEIRLEGHTDIIGEASKNLRLSIDRVIAVRKYLTGKGIEARRIQTKGYGDTRPLITNGTVDERASNRRVEFVVLPK